MNVEMIKITLSDNIYEIPDLTPYTIVLSIIGMLKSNIEINLRKGISLKIITMSEIFQYFSSYGWYLMISTVSRILSLAVTFSYLHPAFGFGSILVFYLILIIAKL